MKVILFKNLNNTGVILDRSRVIPDYLEFEFEEPGTFCVGERTYAVTGGKVFVPQYDVLLGKHLKLIFIDKKGKEYSCGEIIRTGSRIVEFHNNVERTLIDVAAALDDARRENAELRGEIKKIKEQMGISLIGG